MVGAVSGQEMAKQRRGHKARLELTGAQVVALDEQASAAITVWNCLHAYWTHFAGKKPTLAQADAAIRQARKDADFLAVLPAQAAQAVLKTYVQAWENFFNPNHPARRPTFKTKKGRPRLAVDVPQASKLRIVRLSAKWGMVTVPMVGRVRFRWTKALPGIGKDSPAGKVTGARLVKEAGGWHIVFRTERHVPQPVPHRGPKVGIDRGITVPLTLSNGDKLRHKPWLTAGERERLLRLERTAARRRAARTKGEPISHRLARIYDQIAGLRAKAKRRAYDWQHQTTTALARKYSAIVVEDLHIVNMMRSAAGTVEAPGSNVAQKRGLNRAISGESWGRTVAFLTYKSAERGGCVPRVPAQGTSQECHRCHTTTAGSRESQSRFVCKNVRCGWIGNADTNAAGNQLHRYNSAAGSAVTGRGDLQPSGGSVKRQPPRATSRALQEAA